jgi:hypothetical protein
MSMPNHKPKFAMDYLEDRLSPAIFGQTWVSPENLTFSVAPDGTDVAGVNSDLRATLNARMPESVWMGQIRDAFQTWSNVAGFDITARGDTGKPFGSDVDALQNAFWNGDIRIAARPLSSNVLAITNPPDMISPWAGEIILNSNKNFTADGANGTFQLYTVMLQEIGHALGIDNNPTNTASVMYESYQGVRTGLASADVTAIRNLYGNRTNDQYEGSKGNETAATATPLSYINDAKDADAGEVTDAKTYIARAILTAGDTDTYTFTVPTGRTSATVQFVPSSLVRGRIQVFNASGDRLLEATGGSSSVIVKTVSNLTAGQTYTVRVDAEPGTKFAVGSYRVAVGEMWQVSGAMVNKIVTTVYGGDVKGIVVNEDSTGIASNDTIGTATDLGRARSTVDGRWDINAVGRFHSSTDIDFYKIQTRSNTPGVMQVAAWASSGSTKSGLDPQIIVFNASGQRLPMTVLRNSNNTHVVQVTGIQPNTKYYVSIGSRSFGSDTKAKNYNFGIDFRATPIVLTKVGEGTLGGTSTELSRNFTINRSTLVRFELSATSRVGDLNAFARLVIRNSAGAIVHTFDASSGETVAEDVLLAAGEYQVQISGLTTDGRIVNKLDYLLRSITLTDPIGPQLLDGLDGSPTVSQTTETTKSEDPGITWDQIWYVDPVMGAEW